MTAEIDRDDDSRLVRGIQLREDTHPTGGGQLTYDLVRERGGSWRELHVLRDDATEFEVFELGEPIHLSGVVVGDNPDRVWWITRFAEQNGRAEIIVNFTRYGGHGDSRVRVSQIQKLPAMLRLAVESSD